MEKEAIKKLVVNAEEVVEIAEREEMKKNIDAILEAVKELTKTVGDMAEEHKKWRLAGKF